MEKRENTMWEGRIIGNDDDRFFGMTKTKLVGFSQPAGVGEVVSLVVMDFWKGEDHEVEGRDDMEKEDSANAGRNKG